MEVKTLFDTVIFGVFAMTIVMGVLAFLGFIIYLFKFIFYKESKITPPPVEKKVGEKVQVLKKEEKENKKIAAIIAAINMYLASKRRVSFAFSLPKGGEETNIWKLKGVLAKRVSGIKERRWRNG